MSMDDFELEEYGENSVDDMMVDYDYHINTGDLPELFDESSVDDFIANLNDWDYVLLKKWRICVYKFGSIEKYLIRILQRQRLVEDLG